MQLRAMWPSSPHYGLVSGEMQAIMIKTCLVALSGLSAATAHGAIAGDVAGLAALVAGLVVLHGLRAVAA